MNSNSLERTLSIIKPDAVERELEAKIKKIFSKKIEFHDENKIEKKLRNLWKNNIWLDSLSCSIHYKNLLREKKYNYRKDRPNLFL